MRGKMMIENQDECAERGREKVQGRHAEEREFPDFVASYPPHLRHAAADGMPRLNSTSRP